MSRRRESLLGQVVKACAPIVIGEACLAVREHLRREHKARLRRDEASRAAESDATDESEETEE